MNIKEYLKFNYLGKRMSETELEETLDIIKHDCTLGDLRTFLKDLEETPQSLLLENMIDVRINLVI